jgi:hypothetical protein
MAWVKIKTQYFLAFSFSGNRFFTFASFKFWEKVWIFKMIKGRDRLGFGCYGN